MDLGRRDYEIQWQAVLFEMIDGDDRFVCVISLEALDPERAGMIDGETGLKFFDEKADEIVAQAEIAVEQAKANGVRHVPCSRNEPIFVTLAK